MKNEKLITALWGFFLSFVISLSAVACMVTGFSMAVDLTMVALWCGIGALFSAVCFTLSLHPLPLAVTGVTGVILWLAGELELSVQSVLYRVTRQYHDSHGWEILRLNLYTADDMEPKLWLALCFIGVIIAIAVAWAICRRKTAVPGAGLAVVCLMACLVTTETVPKAIWLYCLLFGVLLLMLSHTVRRGNGQDGNRLTLVAAGPLALVLLFLFVLVPQSRYTGYRTAQSVVNAVLENELVQAVFGDLSAAGNSGSSVSGGTVRLDSVGIRTQSQAEILQLYTDFSGTLYLRGRALDAYDGLTWKESDENVSALYWPLADTLESQGEVTVQTKYAHRMLYLPYYVKSMDLNGVTRGVENSKKLNQYSFTTGRLPSDSALSEYTADLNMDVTPYLHLDKDVQKWAQPLAQKITQGKTGVYAQAQAIGNYVRSSARYDLKTNAMPSWRKDFVKWFLEESETGYCVHFASSAVVLLQAAGIPARYVTGYVTRVGRDCYTIVREQNAHAWAEYWLPGFGWTVLEVTPGEQEQSEGTSLPVPEETDLAVDWRIVGILSAAVFAAVILFILVQRSVRLHLRRRLMENGPLKQRVLACWQEATLFARCLGGLTDDRLFAVAQRAKFSQHPPREEDLALFEDYLADARRQLKRHNFFRKLYYRFVLALY